MLQKLKTLIFNNYFFILSLILSTVFFYLSFFNFYFYFLFFLFLFFSNFYYLRGLEIFFNSLISPLPFYFFSFIFNLNLGNILFFSCLLWLIYYFLLIKFKNYSYPYLYFFITLNFYGLFDYINFFITIILYILFVFILFYFLIKENFTSSLIKTIFLSEIFWLSYFFPLNFYWTTCFLLLIFYYLFINKNILLEDL